MVKTSAGLIRLINLYLFSGGGAPSSRPPVFVDGSRTDRSIAENTAAGENVGPPVVATDSGILTFMLGGADAGFFGIVAATGQIQVGDGTILDYEAEKNTYGVEVAATDSSGATARITVTVIVTNVDEAGTVTLPPEEPVVDTALTATLSDPDGDITGTTWQWARTMDMAAGWDDIPGATDAAYTPVATDDGYYLRATAATPTATVRQEHIRATASAVTNLDEAGTVTLSMMRPVVGELTAMLDDPDGNTE